MATARVLVDETDPAANAPWNQAAYEARVRADQAARDATPRPEGACDVTTCREVATLVWHRTDAELATGRKAKVRMLPTFRACATHAAPWRPWLPIGSARPSPAALALVVSKPKRRHCKSCTCGR